MSLMTTSRRRVEASAEQPRLVQPIYLTVGQLAELLGVPKSFVYRRTTRGHPDAIPSYRFGGHLRFLEAEVREWIALHRKEAEPPGLPKLVAARRPRTNGSPTKRLSSSGRT